jgi:hypothetical protein
MGDYTFELYKLLVEEVREAKRARRELSNMFLTLNTGGVGALGFLAQENGASLDPVLLAMLAFALALSCIIWSTSNRYYTLLLAAKYDVIYKLEAELGRSPIRDEYEAIQGKRRSMKWFTLERMMPGLFIVGYILFVLVQSGALDVGDLYQRARDFVAGQLGWR